MSCSWGFTTTGGAKGVGESTTSAVVISLVLIFIADFFLSFLCAPPPVAYSGWYRRSPPCTAMHQSQKDLGRKDMHQSQKGLGCRKALPSEEV